MKNANHPRKGDRIAVDPIRKMKDIKAIMKLLSDNPRDRLLFTIGINNGLRTIDLLNLTDLKILLENLTRSARWKQIIIRYLYWKWLWRVR